MERELLGFFMIKRLIFHKNTEQLDKYLHIVIMKIFIEVLYFHKR